MARLPTIEDFGTRPTPGVQGPSQISAPESGIQDLAQGASVLGEAFTKIKYNDDKLRAEDALNKLQQKSIEYTNGDEGFTNLKAGDVVGKPVYKDYLDRFNSAAEELAAGLENDQQRQFFQRRAEVAKTQYGGNLTSHIQKEKKNFGKQVIEGGKALEIQNSAMNWHKPYEVAYSIKRTEQLIDDQAEQEGWAPDFKKAKKLEALSALHESVIEQAIAADSPEYAKEWYKRNQNEIDSGKFAGLENLINKGEIKILAQEVTDELFNSGLDEKTALSEVRKKYKGDEENAIVASVRDRYREEQRLQDEVARQADNEAWDIYAGTLDFDSIPLTTLEQMNGKTRESLRAYAQNQKAGKPRETRWDVYYGLISEAKQKPNEFANENLLLYTPYLKPTHLEQLMKLQAKPEEIDYVSTQMEIRKRAARDAGLNLKYQGKTNEEAERIDNFYRNLDERIQAYYDLNKKNPDDAALTKITDEMIMDKVMVDYLIKDDERVAATVTQEEIEDKDVYVVVEGKEVFLDQITGPQRKAIVEELIESNRRLPPGQEKQPITEKAIARKWLIKQKKI